MTAYGFLLRVVSHQIAATFPKGQWVNGFIFCQLMLTKRMVILQLFENESSHLTHWGRVTHICVVKLTIIGSDNGLSPGQRQAIIWTNAGILLIGPLGTNFIEILIGIQTFSFKKMQLKMLSAKRHPFSLGLNVLRNLMELTLGQPYILGLCWSCWSHVGPTSA